MDGNIAKVANSPMAKVCAKTPGLVNTTAGVAFAARTTLGRAAGICVRDYARNIPLSILNDQTSNKKVDYAMEYRKNNISC